MRKFDTGHHPITFRVSPATTGKRKEQYEIQEIRNIDGDRAKQILAGQIALSTIN
jgi:hypothetical protein